MEPLYTTTATNTYEEYKRYFNTLSKLKLHIILYCVLSVYLAVLSLYLRWIHTLVFAIVFPVLVIALQLLQRSRIFKTNKILQNATVTYEFFDTFFTNSHQYGNSKIEYEKLHKIIETKTNVYLMISKNQGYILVKENFPDGLDAFLKSIAPKKKKRGKND